MSWKIATSRLKIIVLELFPAQQPPGVCIQSCRYSYWAACYKDCVERGCDDLGRTLWLGFWAHGWVLGWSANSVRTGELSSGTSLAPHTCVEEAGDPGKVLSLLGLDSSLRARSWQPT